MSRKQFFKLLVLNFFIFLVLLSWSYHTIKLNMKELTNIFMPQKHNRVASTILLVRVIDIPKFEITFLLLNTTLVFVSKSLLEAFLIMLT